MPAERMDLHRAGQTVVKGRFPKEKDIRDKDAGKEGLRRRKGLRPVHKLLTALGVLLIAGAATAGWLASRAVQVSDELSAAEAMIPQLKSEVAAQNTTASKATIEKIALHTGKARDAANDPIWRAASTLPIAGGNFAAVTELSIAADEVILGSAKPLQDVSAAMKWDELGPVDGKLNVAALENAAPTILGAANTLDLTYGRLRNLDTVNLIPEVAAPLNRAIAEFGELNNAMKTVADAATLIPAMLGSGEPRNYLVLVQNNAEVRATGGLAGALAVIRVEDGTIEFVAQASGSSMGKYSPPLNVDSEQTAIYSTRLGAYIGDVNLTPDFPTAARNAKAMWETRYGGSIDGVAVLDPVVLAHLLEASGPVALPTTSLPSSQAMPASLTSQNVVSTLLSDVYHVFDTNEAQDAYFASASQVIFQSLVSGDIKGPALLKALSRSFEENRLHLWSSHREDQAVLADTPLGGSISGSNAGGVSFGIYFNDGTGAKMDYYVRRTTQLEQLCSSDEYSQYKVRVTLTNTAPTDAAAILPAAVTGAGKFGVPPGSVQTNVVVYGPPLSNVDTTTEDGVKVTFGTYLHKARPVGQHTVRLAPGETTSVEMIFNKVLQHATPSLVVTPTVQPVNEVTLPTQRTSCDE